MLCKQDKKELSFMMSMWILCNFWELQLLKEVENMMAIGTEKKNHWISSTLLPKVLTRAKSG